MFTQNLNECSCGKPFGTKFWKGRAFWGARHNHHFEWCIGRFARNFHFKLNTRAGDCDTAILLMAGIPFLFDFYLTIGGLFKYQQDKKEREWGFGIHNNAFWIYPGNWANESNAKDPWWLKCHAYHFPWDYDWHTTELLDARPAPSGEWHGGLVYRETRKNRKDFLTNFDAAKTREAEVSIRAPYRYIRKSGEVQDRIATVKVERMTWRMRWCPLLPFSKTRTSIWVSFDKEIGEGVDTWKGGTTGCGYDLKSGETPLECLRRMESERKFSR